MAVYSIKHSSKKPFLEETREDFEESLETYVGGAFTFAQESIKRMFEDHGEKGLEEGGEKKGVRQTEPLHFFHHCTNNVDTDIDLHRHSRCPALQRPICRVWRRSRISSTTRTNPCAGLER
jgi:hypothetical protein